MMEIKKLLEATDLSKEFSVIVALDNVARFAPCKDLPASFWEEEECEYEPGLLLDVYAFDYNNPSRFMASEMYVEGASRLKDVLDVLEFDDYRSVPSTDARNGVYETYELGWGNNAPNPKINFRKSPPFLVAVATKDGYYRPANCDELKKLADVYGFKFDDRTCENYKKNLNKRL